MEIFSATCEFEEEEFSLLSRILEFDNRIYLFNPHLVFRKRRIGSILYNSKKILYYYYIIL